MSSFSDESDRWVAEVEDLAADLLRRGDAASPLAAKMRAGEILQQRRKAAARAQPHPESMLAKVLADYSGPLQGSPNV